ncbi:peptidoglycan-binding domain-containing protein [Limimaricola pyoseonensis]|uniref:Putative peptidoglycan binding domain-containing protein n=1 Tax=Limimaricola pyoseonensis TaxID=521013 RepID=A0A1G7CWN2_9RHOB|nr:peptidoglycan-binding domain-containing protein [Limimaricola pyoseonensis]SDE43864.1 Putative peptidoglycan binding domain-containing protein [Limimaricola pyoseonensis]
MFRTPLLPLLLLAACATPRAEPAVPAFMAARIETRADGRCMGQDITPAVLETVREQVVERPAGVAADGSPRPASYRSVTRQRIVQERREILFETLCPPAFTPGFVETLQRALITRGYHAGPVTGLLDATTLEAVRAYQRATGGPDSPVLSLASAQRLGIVALERDQIEAMSR